jgi:hypothetical protein
MKALKQIIFSAIFFAMSVSVAFAAEPVSKMGGLESTGNAIGYVTNADAQTTLPQTIGFFVNTLVALLGMVFMVLIWIGAFGIIGAGGNDAEVKKGRDRIKNGAIGIFIILAAYFITRLILFIVSSTGFFNSSS